VSQDLEEEATELQYPLANFDERLNDIVGFKPKITENLNTIKKKLTTQQKIARELDYLTMAMDLDAPLRKHWGY